MTLKHNGIHHLAMPSEKDKEELSKKRTLLTIYSKLLQISPQKKIHRKLKPYTIVSI